jgi:hypothetical protein
MLFTRVMKGFEPWRRKAEADLAARFGVKVGTVRETTWRKIFGRGVTVRDGASAAALLVHHSKAAQRRG